MAAGCSKANVLLLFIFIVSLMFVCIECVVLVSWCSIKCSFWFCNHLAEEERTG